MDRRSDETWQNAMLCYIPAMLDDVLTDEMIQVSWHSKPGNFVGLMTLYESNYIRLRRLVPQLDTIAGECTSAVEGDCRLYLRVDGRSRYTTTLTLTYLFETASGPITDPDLQIRVYHDARLAEVLNSAPWHQHEMLASIRSQLRNHAGDRWVRNMMLNKWLDYCVERRHRFESFEE
jgi:uncharacterized protein YqiB (DUF1249 family)